MAESRFVRLLDKINVQRRYHAGNGFLPTGPPTDDPIDRGGIRLARISEANGLTLYSYTAKTGWPSR
jgi:hypothetical protein